MSDSKSKQKNKNQADKDLKSQEIDSPKDEINSKRKLNDVSEKSKNFNETNNSKIEQIDVHSANNWEEADLGDEDRKIKFLKLMGATKVDGPFFII
jgi:hypothetical protein